MEGRRERKASEQLKIRGEKHGGNWEKHPTIFTFKNV